MTNLGSGSWYRLPLLRSQAKSLVVSSLHRIPGKSRRHVARRHHVASQRTPPFSTRPLICTTRCVGPGRGPAAVPREPRESGPLLARRAAIWLCDPVTTTIEWDLPHARWFVGATPKSPRAASTGTSPHPPVTRPPSHLGGRVWPDPHSHVLAALPRDRAPGRCADRIRRREGRLGCDLHGHGA